MQNVDERLKAIIYQVAEERAVAVIEMEGMPDHVHRLVEVDPQSGSEASIPAVRNVAQGFSVDALHPCRMRREVLAEKRRPRRIRVRSVLRAVSQPKTTAPVIISGTYFAARSILAVAMQRR